MQLETYNDYCLGKPGVTAEFPFDEEVLVHKVAGKMFALTNITTFERINVKCDPDEAITLREEYPEAVIPAWHMNKKHWNSILLREGVTDAQVYAWIDASYALVVAKLPEKTQKSLGLAQA